MFQSQCEIFQLPAHESYSSRLTASLLIVGHARKCHDRVRCCCDERSQSCFQRKLLVTFLRCFALGRNAISTSSCCCSYSCGFVSLLGALLLVEPLVFLCVQFFISFRITCSDSNQFHLSFDFKSSFFTVSPGSSLTEYLLIVVRSNFEAWFAIQARVISSFGLLFSDLLSALVVIKLK